MAGEFMGELPIAELQGEAARAGVAEAGQFLGEPLKALPSKVAVFDFVQGFQFFGEFGGEDKFCVAVDKFAALVAVQGFIFLGDFEDADAGFRVLEPILIAAGPPFGDVLLANGFAAEEFGEDGFDLRDLV